MIKKKYIIFVKLIIYLTIIMKLNRAKLINVLCSIDNVNLIKKRDWDNIYKNKTINYWNNLLWEKIFQHNSINGSGIDRYEFYDFCGYFCKKEDCDRIFNMINDDSRCILFSEFDFFLLHIDDLFFTNIMDCLELDEKEKKEAEIEKARKLEIEKARKIEIENEKKIKLEKAKIEKKKLQELLLNKNNNLKNNNLENNRILKPSLNENITPYPTPESSPNNSPISSLKTNNITIKNINKNSYKSLTEDSKEEKNIFTILYNKIVSYFK